MPIINLRSQYPHLSEDIFMEISDPIFEVYDHFRKQINNYDRRARYHRAFYSLDVGDGIETHAVSRVPSPEELWMRKLEKEQLREALEHLPPVRSRRIYAYFMLGMKMVGTARIEGVSRTSVSQSIRSSLKNLKRYFKIRFKQTEMG